MITHYELCCQGFCRVFVPGPQEPQGEIGRGQTTGGVEPGSQVKPTEVVSTGPLSQRAAAFSLGYPGPGGRLHGPQAAPDHDAVLVEDGGDVGDRAEGDELEQLVEVSPALLRCHESGAESLHDLEGDPDPGETLERIVAVAAIGIDDAVGRRQLLVLAVVIEDDDVEII